MTDFENDPGILDSMRTCLILMAKMKGVKLQRAADGYDMITMLNMMEEMESMPMRYPLKVRLRRFKDDAIIFCLTKVLQGVRCFMWLAGKIFGGEVERQAQEFLEQTKGDV